MIDRLIGLKVMLETKKDSKLFGIIKSIDTSPPTFNWIILETATGKEHWVADNELIRLEVTND